MRGDALKAILATKFAKQASDRKQELVELRSRLRGVIERHRRRGHRAKRKP